MNRKLRGMDRESASAIKAMQPHLDMSSRQSQNLVLLATLDNYDKHRLVHPVITTFADASVENVLRGSLPVDEEIHPNVGATVAPGVEVIRWPAETHPRAVNLSATLSVSFGIPGATLRRLFELHAQTMVIVESFPR